MTNQTIDREKIVELLNAVAEKRLHLAAVSSHYDQLRDNAIPPEVRQILDDIEAERKTEVDQLNLAISVIEAEIKTQVLWLGASVKGDYIQAVYTNGRITWDTKALDGYAAGHPEVLPFRKEGEPSVSIRKV